MKEIHITISSRTIYQTYAALLALGILLIASFAHATTPNPGHPWTDVGNGFWQASNSQTSLRTFTFPDSDETVLTTAGAPQSGTVPYGNGTGVLATTTAGANGFVLALSSGIPTWIATTTLANISGTLGLTGGGTNASLTANNGGIVWSNATQLQILAGTATANKVLMSGSTATPSWSTPTYPNAASPTTRKIIVSDGTNWTASTETYATPGTAGQVLMSNGTNWISAATTTAIAGAFLGRQTILTGTVTYTPTAGTNSIIIRMVAGGGGGGGATGATTPTTSVGGGGGSGSYAEKRFAGIAGAASYTVAVGAGGLAGVAANGTGGAGGATTFACPATCTGGALTVTANGGVGGVTAAAGNTILSSLGGAGGGVSTNGDVNSTGQPGQYAVRFGGSTGVSGAGAPSHFGGGGNGLNATGVGVTPVGFGGGGGGAASLGVATANAGGAGAPGVLVIWEFK